MRELCIVFAIMTETIRKALEQIKRQKAAAINRREILDVEIAKLEATEIGLQNALGQQIQAEIAWTNLVRTVINSANRALSAVEVRDTLTSWGYNFTGIRNPLAFFNTILQRLAEQGELVRSDTGRPFTFRRANTVSLIPRV